MTSQQRAFCLGVIAFAMYIAVCASGLAMSAPAHTQAPAQSTVDAATKRLLDAWVQQDLANARTVQARLEAVQALPEWKAYEAAVKFRQDAQGALTKQVAATAPGVKLDFSTVPARIVPAVVPKVEEKESP